MSEKKKYFKHCQALGQPERFAHYFAKPIHKVLEETPTKKMLTRMALEPDFKAAMQELAEE